MRVLALLCAALFAAAAQAQSFPSKPIRLISPYPPLEQDVMSRLAPPSAEHWLGTDPLGRDVLSRILFGSRLSIPVGIAAVLLALVLGTLLGSIAGFVGGRVDEVVMRVTDLMLAFPTVILAMVIVPLVVT